MTAGPVAILSRTPEVQRSGNYIANEMRNPVRWLVAGGVGAAGISRANAATTLGVSPTVLALLALLLITLPGVLWSLPGFLQRKWPGRPLKIASGSLFMMYPRTFHAGGDWAKRRNHGSSHRQPRAWIEQGVPLSQLRVEAVWVGDERGLHPMNAATLFEDRDHGESKIHQLDLTDGKVRVSLCKCINANVQLMPVVWNAGLKTARL